MKNCFQEVVVVVVMVQIKMTRLLDLNCIKYISQMIGNGALFCP
jgi:hypothetical protein